MKLNIICGLILATFSLEVNAQVWTQLDTFPGNPRYGVQVFSIDGKGYLGATGGDGPSSSLYSNLYRYNPGTNTWSTRTSFPGAPRRVGVGFAIDSFGYVGLGWTGSTAYFDFYQYNPYSNTWTQKTTYPGGGGRNSFGTSTQTKGYVGGGSTSPSTSSYKSDFWEYDPISNTWTQKANLGFGVRVGGVAFSIGCMVYMGLGHNGSTPFKDLWAYDPARNTWAQMANFPGVGRNQAFSMVVNGRAIVGGGYQLGIGIELGDYYAYDPISNSWSAIPTFAMGKRSVSEGLNINGVGYIGAGWDSLNVPLNDFWSYTDTSCDQRSFIEITSCGSYTSPFSNKVFDTSGIYFDTTSSSGSCYSITTICLTIPAEYFDSSIVTECDTFISPEGNFYTETGIYYDTLTSFLGCDSVLKTDLTVLHSYSNTLTLQLCSDFIGPSGKTYNTTGIYYDTIYDGGGCDSIVKLELIITKINTQIYQGSTSLSAVTGQANYQWLDCNNGMTPISGQTGQSLFLTANGRYAVAISKNGCIDTSACYKVIGIGISKNDQALSISIHPNPTNGDVTLDFGYKLMNGIVEIYSMQGQKLEEYKIVQSSNCKIAIPEKSGIYFLNVIADNSSRMFKVLKE